MNSIDVQFIKTDILFDREKKKIIERKYVVLHNFVDDRQWNSAI